MVGEKRKGISLRVLQIALILVTVFMSGVVIFFTFRMTETFHRVVAVTEEYGDLQRAAHELMDASDYLTEQVQRFTVNGDRRFMENYFTEADESRRREEAIEKMKIDENTTEAVTQLEEALDGSIHLMDREYYAMRLVIEAQGYSGYPEVLDDVSLSEADSALSPDDKMKKATEMVLDDEYYLQKDRIRKNMQESEAEIEEFVKDLENAELATLHTEINAVRIVVLLQIISILCLVLLTSYLGIHPILKAVDRIKEDSPIPEMGANEFRYLAHAYNKMYARYRTSLERLNFKASHDELTGAYNRAGYDLLMSSLDLSTTWMMLFDVDDFKGINDTYGHEVGDKVLIKLVQVLKSTFRDDDCICRIGGDEFVVFMVHSGSTNRKRIEEKIHQINDELENIEDGLPPISISVGVVHGNDSRDPATLFKKTDAALYESKKSGKHTLTFYSK